MARVKSRDTKPELLMRRLLHRLGYRFRVQATALPGRPDIALTRRKRALFVHGCFWHGHDCSRGGRVPKTNTDYWMNKIASNRRRDARVVEELSKLGWAAHVVWECELPDEAVLTTRLKQALGPPRWAGPDAP